MKKIPIYKKVPSVEYEALPEALVKLFWKQNTKTPQDLEMLFYYAFCMGEAKEKGMPACYKKKKK